ncbi:MAG: TonB-dependent receptor [Burkholderiaceae bacterium]
MHHLLLRHSTLSCAIAALTMAGPPVHAQATSVAASPAGANGAGSTVRADAQSVVVNASADASAGGLKAPYAGGQVARGGRVGILGSEDVMDTPFNVTNYTQKVIQDQQAASIADVLQNDPAVRVARGFGNFQQLYVVRGLPVYSDDMAYNGLYGLLPRQYLAAELVERVEVLRGASAFLNGAAPGGSGLGGAIDVMPKRAANAPLTEATLGAEGGGQVYEAVDVGRRIGPDKALGVRLSAAHRDGGTAVDGEKRELTAVSIGADFHTRDLRVSADIGYQDHELTASTPSITISPSIAIPKPPSGEERIAQPWTYSNERDTFGTLRAEADLSSRLTAWAAGGFRNGREANTLTTLTVSAADGTDSALAFKNARKDTVGTGEAGLRGKFATGSVGHTVVGSVSLYSLASKNAYGFADFAGAPAGTIYATTAIAEPDEAFSTGGKLDAPLTTLRTQTRSVALADTLSFAGDRVLLTLGARHQKIENSSYDYGTGAENAPGPNKASRITPVAGLVFKAGKLLSLYATYIEGLVAGDIAPQTYQDAGFVSHPVQNHGQVFKPYQTKQGEIGAKLDDGRFGYTLSLFQSRKPSAAVDTATGIFGVNQTQRNRGAELSFYGEAAPGLRVLGGVSLLNTRVTGVGAAGRHAIGSPKSQFNLGADWDVPGVAGLAVEGRAVHTSTQFADAANRQAVPSWSRFDVGARYAFDAGAREVTLRARVNNVADRNYWASVGGFPGAGYLTVGEPRTFVVSGTVGF